MEKSPEHLNTDGWGNRINAPWGLALQSPGKIYAVHIFLFKQTKPQRNLVHHFIQSELSFYLVYNLSNLSRHLEGD